MSKLILITLILFAEENASDRSISQSCRRRGLVERPGAYYASVLVKLLEQRQVFVPTAGEDAAEEVQRLAGQSLGL